MCLERKRRRKNRRFLNENNNVYNNDTHWIDPKLPRIVIWHIENILSYNFCRIISHSFFIFRWCYYFIAFNDIRAIFKKKCDSKNNEWDVSIFLIWIYWLWTKISFQILRQISREDMVFISSVPLGSVAISYTWIG